MIAQFYTGPWGNQGFHPGGKFTRPLFLTAFFITLFSACNSANAPVTTAAPLQNITPSGSGASPNSPGISHLWKLQDLSVLLPIPKAVPNPDAIHPSQATQKGVLIPVSLLNKLPLLEPNLFTATQGSQLELVSARFDPTSQQIRLVWQVFKNVVNPDGTPSIVAFDTAVHAFYQMPDTNAFLTDLAQVNTLSDGDYTNQTPLFVHPTLAKQGMNGAYAQAFKNLLYKYCGDQTIIRLTFMQASGEHLHWTFGGFTYNQGVIQNFMIPKVNINTTQTFTNSSPSAAEFMGGVDVVPPGQNEFDAVITNSIDPQNVTSSNLELAHFTSVTLENPVLSPTDFTDCASCHVAGMEKLSIEDRAPGTTTETANVYTSSNFNLSNPSVDVNRSDNLRAFGYFAGVPSVSQRTINESASIADQLNQKN